MARKAKWENFSIEEIKQIVKESNSNREVARKLGYAMDGGGSMTAILSMYKKLGLDTSHFKGQGWNKGCYAYETFVANTPKKNGASIRTPLEALRGKKCECCGLSEWQNKPLQLEVHHIDGNHHNNALDNLKLLCPNCHSQTDNFRNKTPKPQPIITDEEFVETLKNSKNIRQALICLGLSARGANYERAYNLIHMYNITHLIKKSGE